jgi:hypothetical protein
MANQQQDLECRSGVAFVISGTSPLDLSPTFGADEVPIPNRDSAEPQPSQRSGSTTALYFPGSSLGSGAGTEKQSEPEPPEHDSSDARNNSDASWTAPQTSPVPASWYSRPKVTDWITAASAALLLAALVYFGVGLQKQFRTTAAQAVTASQNAALMAQAAARTDQRAWVGLIDATVLPLTSTGGGFTVRLQNTGKTPALDMKLSAVIKLDDIERSSDDEDPTTGVLSPAGTLMPGATFATDVRFQTSPVAVAGLANNQNRAVSYLFLTYKDVFQQSHLTKVCFYWHGSLHRVNSCDKFNEMN